MNINLLPIGWSEVLTGDTFSQVSTGTKKVKTKDCKTVGKYPVIDQGQADIAGFVDDESKVINVVKPLVIFGDHTRAIKWIIKDFVPGADGTKVLAAVNFLEPKYFYYQLRSLELPDKGYARHFRYLNETSFKVAPLAEQQQIAAKLDELLAQVDNLKTRLDNIPKILKRFRQSVLAAAVIGKLTEDWRKDNHYSDSYPTLWPKKGLSEYGKLARGKSKHRPRNDSRLFGSQYPFIQTGEISNSGGRVSSATKFYSEFGFLQSKLFPSGTLCITIAANIADTAILDIDACFPDSVVGFSPDKNKCVVEFVKYLIDVNKGNLEEFAPATAQKNINLQVLNELLLPFPDLEEQTKIVARVEQLFTYADQIEQRVKDAQSRVNHLTQAILAKAFRGELTADWRVQNPELISGENSAEALLARIKAEREQTQAVKKAKATPATKSECSHYKGSES